jgi:hypothetical protein
MNLNLFLAFSVARFLGGAVEKLFVIAHRLSVPWTKMETRAD